MKKHLLLVVVFAGTFVATGADLQTNQLMIGYEKVDTEVVDGKLVGDRWMVNSNTLIRVHAELALIQESSHTPEKGPASKIKSGPTLRLLMCTGNDERKFGRAKGFHGIMYLAKDWRTPNVPQTNRVDILSAEDDTRIVMMVGDNGPIYSSTNSGMNWEIITQPGEYEFVLSLGPKGGGFMAAATIRASPENQSAKNSPVLNWYAVGSASDGSRLVMTGGASQLMPALAIRHSGGGMVVAWPATFTGYVLQANTDLSSTNWVDVTDPVRTAGDENQVLVSSTSANGFYRLKSQ